MKGSRRSSTHTGKLEVAVRMRGFKRSEEQFGMPQDFEMAAGFYDASDSWNQMLIRTMHNMRLSCQFFN